MKLRHMEGWEGGLFPGLETSLGVQLERLERMKADSEAGNFSDSAAAKIGNSLVGQIKGYYSRNSPLSLFL